MRKAYDVQWSERAETDLASIIEYIARGSPANAYEVFKTIRRKASNLYIFPDRGRIVSELQSQGIAQYRELIVVPWRIIYRISQRKVYVLSVLDSRRNVEDILLERFTRESIY